MSLDEAASKDAPRSDPFYPSIIAVGSTNPVKVEAVRSVVQQVWSLATVLSVAVESGVSAMPMSDAEVLIGARTRAVNAIKQTGADLALGLEGGVNPEPPGLMLHGWVVALDQEGREGVGGSARIPLPKWIADQVITGEELGPIMDRILGQHNVKQKGGAVGALTGGLVLRRDAFSVAVAISLSPFLSPDLYWR